MSNNDDVGLLLCRISSIPIYEIRGEGRLQTFFLFDKCGVLFLSYKILRSRNHIVLMTT